MHSLRIDVNDKAYHHVLYLLNNIHDVQIKEDIIVPNEKKESLMDRVQASEEDIKQGRVSDFDFNQFVSQLDEL